MPIALIESLMDQDEAKDHQNDNNNKETHDEGKTDIAKEEEDKPVGSREPTADSSDIIKLRRLGEPRYAFALCVTPPGNDVFAIGGTDGSNYLRSVETFSSSTGCWTPMPKLQFARGHLGGCALLDGRVVVLGGQCGKNVLKSAEVYDPAKRNWRVLPPMMEPRQSCSALALGSVVYALGGRDEFDNHGKVLRSCESLEVGRSSGWSAIKPLKQARSGLAAVALRGRLYVVGGTNGVKPLNTVEVYHPHSNSWTPGPPLNRARAWPALTVWEDSLLIIGGRESTAQEIVDSIEVWRPCGEDKDEGSWHIRGISGLPSNRWFWSAVTVDSPITSSNCTQAFPCAPDGSPSFEQSACLPRRAYTVEPFDRFSGTSTVAAVAAKFEVNGCRSAAGRNAAVAPTGSLGSVVGRGQALVRGRSADVGFGGFSLSTLRRGREPKFEQRLQHKVTPAEEEGGVNQSDKKFVAEEESESKEKRRDDEEVTICQGGLERPKLMRNLLPADVMEANQLSAKQHEGVAQKPQAVVHVQLQEDESAKPTPSKPSRVDKLRASFEQSTECRSAANDPMSWFEE
eukprot:GHVS01059818.1.p1 GENE.GHVS01059818.1~~GHVS01059818.1.p1  ORF type:complete len:651 (+),score=113.59 GHVS01059818.1:245-1954(+)